MLLKDYIQLHYDGISLRFAEYHNVPHQSVSRWIRDEWIVINHRLYSPRRALVKPK